MIVVVAITALMAASHVASLWAMSAGAADAGVINLAGRQRMLSQRILYFASGPLTARMRGELTEALDAFEAAHLRLSRAPSLSAPMRAIYFDATEGRALDALVGDYLRDGRAVAAAADARAAAARIAALGEDLLLERLNAAVSQFEREATERAEGLAAIQSWSLAAALLGLLVEAGLVMAPVRGTLLRAEADRARAEHDASHDALTGLDNRRGFERALAERCDPRSAGRPLVALHIDLDGFKALNDRFGHAAGDEALSRVGAALRAATRSGDVVARTGGDEFVILTDAQGAGLDAMIARIRAELARPVEIGAASIAIGASIGVARATATPGGAVDPSRLLADADAALYDAKRVGRGRVVVHGVDAAAA